MKFSRKISSLFTLLVIGGFLISPITNFTGKPALAASDILLSALSKLETPESGQVVYSVYELYDRTPPESLEPSDPYHLPFKDFWFSKTIVHQWLEIGDNGLVSRWRTKLLDDKGQLLQDLMFDGTNETDYFANYFANKKRVIRSPRDKFPFIPDRKGFIEYYLKQDKVRLRSSVLEGHSVNSIYEESRPLHITTDVESNLLSYSNPFVVDLKPQSLSGRIDFDPLTNLPLRQATVVIDSLGAEQVISYRTFPEPQVLSHSEYDPNILFRQEIPDSVLASEASESYTPLKALTTLDGINQYVDYPLYTYQSTSDAQLELVATDLTLPDSTLANTQFPQEIELASALGIGPEEIYTVKGNEPARFLVIQGPADEMRSLLQQTKPVWTLASQTTIRFDGQEVIAWELTTAKSDQIIYIIEKGSTIIYVKSTGISLQQAQENLSHFSVLPKPTGAKTFIPLISR